MLECLSFFMTNSDISPEELQVINEIWINIKDDSGVNDMIVDKEIDKLHLM